MWMIAILLLMAVAAMWANNLSVYSIVDIEISKRDRIIIAMITIVIWFGIFGGIYWMAN